MLNLTFNQEFHFCKREHQFIEEFCDLNLCRPFSFRESDNSDDATSHGISEPRSSGRGLHLPSFPLFDLHRSIHKSPRVTPSFTKCKIMSQPLDVTNEIDGYELITCV